MKPGLLQKISSSKVLVVSVLIHLIFGAGGPPVNVIFRFNCTRCTMR